MSKRAKNRVQDDFVDYVTRVLKRAVREARRVAKMHGTKVWVMRDGKLVGIKP